MYSAPNVFINSDAPLPMLSTLHAHTPNTTTRGDLLGRAYALPMPVHQLLPLPHVPCVASSGRAGCSQLCHGLLALICLCVAGDFQQADWKRQGHFLYSNFGPHCPQRNTAVCVRSLTERPAPGEVITVTATVEDLPGNMESLVPHVATRARTASFVGDDFGRQFVGAVNVSGARQPKSVPKTPCGRLWAAVCGRGQCVGCAALLVQQLAAAACAHFLNGWPAACHVRNKHWHELLEGCCGVAPLFSRCRALTVLQQSMFSPTERCSVAQVLLLAKALALQTRVSLFPGITAPVPGGLQRFSLVLDVTSSARPGEHRMSAIKGMVTDSLRAWWTAYKPVVVASLPYHGYAPVRLAAWL